MPAFVAYYPPAADGKIGGESCPIATIDAPGIVEAWIKLHGEGLIGLRMVRVIPGVDPVTMIEHGAGRDPMGERLPDRLNMMLE